MVRLSETVGDITSLKSTNTSVGGYTRDGSGRDLSNRGGTPLTPIIKGRHVSTTRSPPALTPSSWGRSEIGIGEDTTLSMPGCAWSHGYADRELPLRLASLTILVKTAARLLLWGAQIRDKDG